MSHVVEIETEIRDVGALRAACCRLGLTESALETTRLFSGEATGYCVRLPDWKYPAVFDTATGQGRFDNYGGLWGGQQQLDRFLQAYAVEKARLEVRRQRHTVTEQPLADGSIKLTIHVGEETV